MATRSLAALRKRAPRTWNRSQRLAPLLNEPRAAIQTVAVGAGVGPTARACGNAVLYRGCVGTIKKLPATCSETSGIAVNDARALLLEQLVPQGAGSRACLAALSRDSERSRDSGSLCAAPRIAQKEKKNMKKALARKLGGVGEWSASTSYGSHLHLESLARSSLLHTVVPTDKSYICYSVNGFIRGSLPIPTPRRAEVDAMAGTGRVDAGGWVGGGDGDSWPDTRTLSWGKGAS
ncbi:unnamed protein product [Lampetra planeri]